MNWTLVKKIKQLFNLTKRNKMEKLEDIKITVESDGRKLILTTPWDTDIWGMADVFRSILFWMTFGEATINRAVKTSEDECDCECSTEDN
jgi:hypothetical protein